MFTRAYYRVRDERQAGRSAEQVRSSSAASIIAKVTRDRLMTSLSQKYPGYGWEHNAGYPTIDHRAALRQRGLYPINHTVVVKSALLREHRPGQIIYISCHPATMARDLNIFCREGVFKLASVVPLDMFPQTAHVECIGDLRLTADGGTGAALPAN